MEPMRTKIMKLFEQILRCRSLLDIFFELGDIVGLDFSFTINRIDDIFYLLHNLGVVEMRRHHRHFCLYNARHFTARADNLEVDRVSSRSKHGNILLSNPRLTIFTDKIRDRRFDDTFEDEVIHGKVASYRLQVARR
jgi:hypothetical protein